MRDVYQQGGGANARKTPRRASEKNCTDKRRGASKIQDATQRVAAGGYQHDPCLLRAAHSDAFLSDRTRSFIPDRFTRRRGGEDAFVPRDRRNVRQRLRRRGQGICGSLVGILPQEKRRASARDRTILDRRGARACRIPNAVIAGRQYRQLLSGL